jgi:hypothetical protein
LLRDVDQLFERWRLQPKELGAGGHPSEMLLEAKILAAVKAAGFEHAVAQEKPAIVDGDACLFALDPFPVQKRNRHQLTTRAGTS